MSGPLRFNSKSNSLDADEEDDVAASPNTPMPANEEDDDGDVVVDDDGVAVVDNVDNGVSNDVVAVEGVVVAVAFVVVIIMWKVANDFDGSLQQQKMTGKGVTKRL